MDYNELTAEIGFQRRKLYHSGHEDSKLKKKIVSE